MYVFANEVLTYEDETYEVESTPDRRKRFVTVSRGTMSKNSAAWEIGRGRDRDGLMLEDDFNPYLEASTLFASVNITHQSILS